MLNSIRLIDLNYLFSNHWIKWQLVQVICKNSNSELQLIFLNLNFVQNKQQMIRQDAISIDSLFF